MKAFFKGLFEYNHHMNQKLIAALVEQTGEIPGKSIQLMSHVLNAHEVWNSRIETLVPQYGIWQVHDVQTWAEIERNNTQKTLEIVARADMDQAITYKTSQGQPFENTVRDILFHVINHSTYHRGQMASDMKQHNIDPISSDYIFYKR